MDITERNTQDGEPAAVTIPLIDIQRIMHDIPHRYPMLMIDRVESVVLNESAIGVKNVTVNEQFFQGHFPEHPVMPGVLIIDAMAQTSAVLVVESLGAFEDFLRQRLTRIAGVAQVTTSFALRPIVYKTSLPL